MLELYIRRSGLTDGMSLLDLGCDWGSVALHMAGKFPDSQGRHETVEICTSLMQMTSTYFK